MNSIKSIFFFLLINFIVFKALYQALFLCLGSSHLQMGQFLHIGLNRLCHNYPFYCDFTVREIVFFFKCKFQRNSNALVNILSFPVSKGNGPWSRTRVKTWAGSTSPRNVCGISHNSNSCQRCGLPCAWRMGIVLCRLSHLILTSTI